MDLKCVFSSDLINTGDSAIPLPEGWPFADHKENNASVAKEKLAYRIDGKPVYEAVKKAVEEVKLKE